MAKNSKSGVEAVDQIVDIMMRSLEKFPPVERERRLRRIEAALFQNGIEESNDANS